MLQRYQDAIAAAAEPGAATAPGPGAAAVRAARDRADHRVPLRAAARQRDRVQGLPAVPGIGGSDWSGWANFSVIFNGDPAFLRALKNTLILTSLQSVFVFPAPILLALLLNSLFSERIKRIAQSILYLPHFMSWVIVVALFQQMLGGSGLLNNYLRSHDLATLDIIGNSDLFHVLLTVADHLEGHRLGDDPVPGRAVPDRLAAVRGGQRGRREPDEAALARHPAGAARRSSSCCSSCGSATR